MRWWIVCVVTALSGFGVGASPQAPQTFRTTTRLVEVSVVVTSGSGRPVTGLTQTDFTLEEDGKAQAIAFFEARQGAARPRPEESPFRVAAGPGVFTNVDRVPSGTSTILLLDRTNASFESQWYARKHINRFLDGMRRDDRVALYVLDGTILVLQDFTSDAALLKQALERYHAHVTGDYAASNEAALPSPVGAPWLVDPGSAMSDFFTQKRRIETLELLNLLAGHLAGVSGRKNLVWISEAFVIPEEASLDRLEVLEKLRRANHALAHAQVSVYPVDSRGLVGAYSVAGGRVVFNNLRSVRANIETMEVVADETGGRTYANTNALDRSIASAVDDSRVSYVLGYYPSTAATDGRYRRIDVTVNRKNVRVRHRSGYFATATAHGERNPGAAAARAALEGPLQTTGLGLAAHVVRSGDELIVTLRIDPDSVSLTQKDGRWHGTLEILAAQVNKVGRGIVEATVALPLALADDELARARVEGISLTRTIKEKPGAAEFRLVARDTATGKVGSLVIPAARVR